MAPSLPPSARRTVRLLAATAVSFLLTATPACGAGAPAAPASRPTAEARLPIPLAPPSGPCLTLPSPCAWSASEQVLMVVGSVKRAAEPTAARTEVRIQVDITNRSNPGRTFTVTSLSFALADRASHRHDVAAAGSGCAKVGTVPVPPGDTLRRTVCFSVPTATAERLVLIWTPGAGISDLDYNDFAVALS